MTRGSNKPAGVMFMYISWNAFAVNGNDFTRSNFISPLLTSRRKSLLGSGSRDCGYGTVLA